jgi:hypothetical protein
MLRLAIVALLATSACRISLEDDGGDDTVTPSDGGRLCKVIESSQTCKDAVSNQNLAWIEQNIFTPNCGGNSCHGNTPLPGGRIVLTTMSHDKLVGADAELAPGRKLVVAGNVRQSYLMVLLRHLSLGDADPSPAPAPPEDPGYMPQNSDPICCQKIDSIVRWIEGGALNN